MQCGLLLETDYDWTGGSCKQTTLPLLLLYIHCLLLLLLLLDGGPLAQVSLSLVQYWKMLGNQSAESPLVCVPSKSRPANQLHQPMLITSLTLDVCVSLSVSLGFSYRANL